MKRAAIYARVSTHNGQNPEMQLDELRAFCKKREKLGLRNAMANSEGVRR
jgi:DNA invertase Pin-like site-specific DNA recombinase